MKKTARYLPARSFILEAERWHPKNRAEFKDRFTGGIRDHSDMEMFNPGSLVDYPWALISAGHSDLTGSKPDREYWVKNRDRSKTKLLSDSGGFQIAKGTWKVRINPMGDEFRELRQRIFDWQERTSDWAVSLDVPSLILSNPEAMKATGIDSYDLALEAMVANLDWYMENSNGTTGWLNALQGRTFEETDRCYGLVKEFNRPRTDRDYCRGWAFGGLQAYSAEAIIRRLIAIKWDGLLETTEWLHFLGRSKLYHTVLYSEFANCFPDIQMTYDSSGPFVTAARGNIYAGWTLTGSWPLKSMDIPFGSQHIGSDTPALEILGSGCYATETMRRLTAGDIVADNGRDSALDGLSYIYLMTHNLELLFKAQERAIEHWQEGHYPKEFDFNPDFGSMLQDIFGASSREQALGRLEHLAPWFKGLTNHKPQSTTQFEQLFEVS